MYVIFANAVGGSAPWRFNGGSAVYEPEGRPLVRAADTGEAVVVATLDPAELARVRAEHPMLTDRRARPRRPADAALFTSGDCCRTNPSRSVRGVPLLFLDLDNTLLDRAGAFRRWAEEFLDESGRPETTSSGSSPWTPTG